MSDEPGKKPLPSIVGILSAAPLAGPADPAAAPGPDGEGGYDDGDACAPDGTDWALVRGCAGEPQNDIGNSRRLLRRHGADMLHVQNIGWHVYDGRRWKEDIDGIGTRPRCHETVELIALESFVLEPSEREQAELDAAERARRLAEDVEAEIRDLDDRDVPERQRAREKAELRRRLADCRAAVDRGANALKQVSARRAQRRRFANTSGNKGKLDGMLAEIVSARSHPVSDLDADALALNVGNGTLRFVETEIEDPECPDPDATRTVRRWTVRLDPHERADLISKLAECDYDPGASAPTFDRFLSRIIEAEAIRDFVQRWFGYNATALTAEQCFALFHGEGANGKSTLVDIVARLLGDYAASVPIDTIVSSGGPRKGSEATPDLVRLPGARAVRSAEPKEGVSFDEALIKQLTSSEPIQVRRLHAEFIDVYPTFKLTVSVNRKPPIRGNDDGIWRRVHLVPFGVQIPKAERDKRLGDKLWLERSGILNWLVAGALDYLNRGALDPPEEVLAATEEYREESDVIALFVQGGCDVTKNPNDRVEGGRLYEAFLIWCKRNGTTAIAATTFNRRMPKTAAQFGLEKGKSSVVVYTGLTIKPAFLPSNPLAHPPNTAG